MQLLKTSSSRQTTTGILQRVIPAWSWHVFVRRSHQASHEVSEGDFKGEEEYILAPFFSVTLLAKLLQLSIRLVPLENEAYVNTSRPQLVSWLYQRCQESQNCRSQSDTNRCIRVTQDDTYVGNTRESQAFSSV